MSTKVSNAKSTAQPLQRLVEATTITKIVGAAVTGSLSYVAAVFTTVVESGGFWQYFCLGACIFFFVSAVCFVIFASRDGLRLDHEGLSFEPHDKLTTNEAKTQPKEDRPEMQP